MDLRTNLDGLTPKERIDERRKRAEQALDFDLSLLEIKEFQIGQADEKNCEQMIGAVPIPVGLAGPLQIHFSSNETRTIYLPLATTEGALVASVNRGCKAITAAGGVKMRSTYHGVTRSIAFQSEHRTSPARMTRSDGDIGHRISNNEATWKKIGESTSNHLKILSYTIDTSDHYLFLTITADTDEAMGMNMVTIAAEAIGAWIEEHFGLTFITAAANVDSDKKPSKRTHDLGRGYEVHAEAVIPEAIIKEILKTTPEAMLAAADAKLRVGSNLAGALGRNLHAANMIAALYLATGQDPAHVVEGSMADTEVRRSGPEGLQARAGGPLSEVRIHTRIPSLMIGVRGGGTDLPAQNQCLQLLLGMEAQSAQELAEIIGAAVLAGELSLLAAQASRTLGKAHRELGR